LPRHRPAVATVRRPPRFDLHLGLMDRPRRHGPGAGLVLGDQRLEHDEREPRRRIILELAGAERQLARALADGMGQGLAQIARRQVDSVGLPHVGGKVARPLPLEPLEVPFELFRHATARDGRAETGGSAGGFASSTSPATSSPTAGPCLKPCPEPPPTSHAFAAAGWRSMMKCSSGEFSYWHTRDSTSGASLSAGKRNAR